MDLDDNGHDGAASIDGVQNVNAPMQQSLKDKCNRSAELLSILRDDATFKDGVIAVEEQEIYIHCAIVAPLSNYLSKALCNELLDGGTRRIELLDTSHRAAVALVDFAYACDFEAVFEEDIALLLEVWKLSDRLQIEDLATLCEDTVLSFLHNDKEEIMDYCIPLHDQAHSMGMHDCKKELFLRMCLNFEDDAFNWEGFGKLCLDDLHKLLSSSDLVAVESTKLYNIIHWISSENDRKEHLEILLGTVNMPFMNQRELRYLLDQHADFFSIEHLRCLLFSIFSVGIEVHPKLLPLEIRPSQWDVSAAYMLPVQKMKSWFQVAGWNLTAAFMLAHGSLQMEIQFLQRTDEMFPYSLEKELLQFNITISTLLILDSSDINEKVRRSSVELEEELKCHVCVYEPSPSSTIQVFEDPVELAGADLLLVLSASSEDDSSTVSETEQ